jgi:CubicO group peptidase (beta-lactamase class C family)
VETVAPESVGVSARKLGRITDALRRWVDERQASGFVALVARHGKIAYFESVGSRDLEAGAPMERDAIFRIYSMSKPITTAAVMMLLEEGRFLLDDPIADFIPEFARTRVFAAETPSGMALADLERPITIRHLLTHTSGLTYGNPNGGPVDRAYASAAILRPDEALEGKVSRLASLPLAFQPGDRWNYGVSIDVLGRLVEVVSGKRFGAFLQERLFGPLEMPDTAFTVPAEKASRLATVYSRTEGGQLARDDAPFGLSASPAFESGGGGLYSTASDYFRFAQMLLGGRVGGTRLLGRKTVELMAAPQSFRDGRLIRINPAWSFSRGYAMALGVRTLVDVGELGLPGSVGSYNWEGAASTAFWVDPREDLVGVLMLQRLPGVGRPSELFRSLTYAALGD